MPKYYFSFGSGHHDVDGRTLDGYYTTIEAESEDIARQIFVKRYGVKWSGTYSTLDVPRRWGWEEIWFEDIGLCSQLPQEVAVKIFGHEGAYRYSHHPLDREAAIRIIENLQEEFDL